ncbi:potassium transporter 5-like isoform X2 [Quercus robur]|uniref:potassium transporter 5-like isoform X2 n=1 Tax=Quercus robur TaxID=38942 RepID=UPI00216210B3|nr:potassium transporter 5-like isoform X2 [Quercus robur]
MSENLVEAITEVRNEEVSQEVKESKVSWQKDLDIESRNFPRPHHGHDSKAVEWSVIFHLAFQSIGVVYGDIGTSPLYVFSSTFPNGIKHNDDILGVLSLILYTLTLLSLIKYVLIVLKANDKGEGGTFALYSLLCRYAKLSFIPNQQAEDYEVSNYQIKSPNRRVQRASWLKSKLEKSKFPRHCLLIATMLGTSMLIGDGVLTPSISVLSAVGGIQVAIPAITEGTEALFADLGHFTALSIQISMCFVTYPALLLAYIGQASFLRKHSDLVANTFHKSIPESLFWPMFVVAVLASIIASQSIITGTFSILQQSLSLGCFPRVKVVHTSAKYEGQVYVPEANYLLMLACVAITLGFRTTTNIGNAFGLAVVFVMVLTSFFLVLVMILIWKSHIILVISYVLTIGSVELIFLSSVFYKFDQGGYLPLAFAAILMTVMYVWNNVFQKKYYYELEHKISMEKLKEIVADNSFCRIPGLAMFYSEFVQGIPPIFKHYVENVPALHSVLVFITIKSLPISKVQLEERFQFHRVEPKELNIFRCVVRYGYTDVHNEKEPFEKILIERLKMFIRDDFWLFQNIGEKDGEILDDGLVNKKNEKEDVREVEEDKQKEAVEREMEVVDKACHAGIVHLIGETEVIANKEANIGKRIMIGYAYNFLKKNLGESEKVFDVPHKRMMKVGMTYEL